MKQVQELDKGDLSGNKVASFTLGPLSDLLPKHITICPKAFYFKPSTAKLSREGQMQPLHRVTLTSSMKYEVLQLQMLPPSRAFLPPSLVKELGMPLDKALQPLTQCCLHALMELNACRQVLRHMIRQAAECQVVHKRAELSRACHWVLLSG